MATVEEKAAALALKAEHYSNAFRLAAEIVERRKTISGVHTTQDGAVLLSADNLISIFREKADLEDIFAKSLRADPLGTWEREGL